jgi:putative ABC transport system permease protein
MTFDLFSMLAEWWRRIRVLARRTRFDDELREEMAFHVERRAREYEKAGHSPEEARRRAARRFGPELAVRETARAAWGWRPLEELAQDARYGLRMFRRDTSVTAVVVVTLALTIGLASAMFAVVDHVLIRRLPYRDPDSLAMIWTADRAQNLLQIGTGFPIVERWRALNRSFEDMVGASRTRAVTISRDNEAERIQGAVVSANLFPLLGTPPLLGRTISADDESSRRRVVVISAGLWRERWGSAPDVVGSTLMIDGQATTVIGVMPAAFQFPSKEIRLWQPLTSLRDWEASRTLPFSHFWIVVGRLRPHVTASAAQSDMTIVGRQIAREFPSVDLRKNSAVSFDVNVVPMALQVVDAGVRRAVWLLFGAVLVVVLIACSNVANILLARGTARSRELAIRTAVGGGRGRLVRQMVTEALLLSAIGGALGIGLAQVALRTMVVLGAGTVPRLENASIDARVLAFTLVLSVGVALIFGVAPALETARLEAGETLKAGGRSIATPSGKRLRAALIVGEFALALILVAASALLVRSLVASLSIDAGFHPENVLTARVEYPRGTADAVPRAFYRAALERIEHLPGVLAAGVISRFVIDTNPDDVITVEGREPVVNEQLWDDSVSPDYFRAAGTPIIRGRPFTDADTETSLHVAIVNETMVRRFWGGEDPIGRRFKMGAVASTQPWITVVGIVADMRRQGPERAPISQIFVPHWQSPGPGMLREVDLLVRVTGDPTGYQSVVRETLRNLDSRVPVSRVATLERQMSAWTLPRRLETAVLGIFSSIALALAAIGIYGLLHYSIAQRTREIGIRMALGARRSELLRGVLREALVLTAAGAAIGLPAVVVAGRVMRGLLFNVSPIDPASIGGAVAVLIAATLAGALLPAIRTTRVDPLVVLRTD